MQTSTRSRARAVTAVITASAASVMAIAASVPAQARTTSRLAGARLAAAAGNNARVVNYPEPVPMNEVGGAPGAPPRRRGAEPPGGRPPAPRPPPAGGSYHTGPPPQRGLTGG